MALFIIRYGEIGLKSSRVRRHFEIALKSNITARFIKEAKECRIKLERGRIYLWSDDAGSTIAILRKTFGIVSFSQAIEISSDKDEICRTAAEISKPLFRKGMSFRVQTRRTGQHSYTSMELAKEAGSAIWMANEDKEPRVDLTSPDLTIYVEVRDNRAFVFSKVIQGPGGMPVGTQGKVLAIAGDETDAVAAWLMMKRGCRVLISASDEAIIGMLGRWDPNLKTIEPNELAEAGILARKYKAEGLVLGWTLSGFENNKSEVEALALPVFYPLMGMSQPDVDHLLEYIKS